MSFQGVPADVVSWWRVLGGPNVVSLWAWVITLPVYVGSTFVVSSALVSPGKSTSIPTIAALAAIGYVIAGGVLWSARGLLPSIVRNGTRSVATLLTYVSAGLAAGLWDLFALQFAGIPPQASWLSRLLSSIVITCLALTLATLLVDARRKHRASQRLLHEQLALADRMRANARQSVAQYRAELVAEVRAVVESQLTAIIDRDAQSNQEQARRLRGIVDEVVRPLSVTLRGPGPEVTELAVTAPVKDPQTRRAPGLRFVKALVTERPFAPVAALAVFLLASILPGVSAVGSNAFIAVALPGSLVIFGGLMLARGVLTPYLRTCSLTVAVLLTLGVWVGLSVLAAFASFALVDLSGVGVDPEIFRRVGRTVFTATMTSAAVFAVTRQWANSEAALAQAVAAVSRQTANLRLQHWAERRDLGQRVHGLVQAEIVSAAVALTDPMADADAILEELSMRLHHALDAGPPANWRAALTSVETVWARSISLDVQLDDEVVAALDREASVAVAVVDIIREAITNAVRAGNADTVTVTATATTDAIVIDVIDDGDGLDPGHVPGGGSLMLDEVCLSWSREDTGGGSRLVAVVARDASAMWPSPESLGSLDVTVGYPNLGLDGSVDVPRLPAS